jgi:glycosyltransferase involved in cell wall biosynthesis
MSSRPAVSVVIPAYNAELRIRPTLASVLAQSAKNFEIIVVDDGSADATASQVEVVLRSGDRPFTVIRQENRGPSAARNAGWKMAQGEWIQFLDDDDSISSQKIERQIEAVAEQPEALAFVVSRWARRFRSHNSAPYLECEMQPLLTRNPFEDLLHPNNFMHFGCGLVRRSWLERTGGFDERLWHIEDVDLQARIVAIGGAIGEVESTIPLFYYNERQGSLSTSNRQEFVEGCVRNAVEVLRLAGGRGEITPKLRELVCGVLTQGILHYSASKSPRFDELFEQVRAIDPKYFRKRGFLFSTMVAALGWRQAEIIAARLRTCRRI